MKDYKLLLLCLGLLTAFCCAAQEKKILTKEDYKLWSTLGTKGMSRDGKWVSYTLTTDSGFVLHTKNSVTGFDYLVPKGYSQQFSNNSRWLGYIVKDSLILLELATKKKHFIGSGVSEFSFSQKDAFLVASMQQNSSKSLWVMNLKTMEMIQKPGVEESKVSPDGNAVAMVTLSDGIYSTALLTLNSGITQQLLAERRMPLKGLQWDSSGSKLVFFEELKKANSSQTNHIVYWWSSINGKPVLKQMNPKGNPSFPEGYFIPNAKAYVSEQQNSVFFDIKKVADSTEISLRKDMRIWKSEDLSIDPDESRMHIKSIQYWTLWRTDDGSLLRVEDETYGSVVLTGDDRNALLYDPFELAPMHKYGGDYIAVYLKSLTTGNMDLIAPKQVYFTNETLVSPGGKYVAYFTENKWWVYSVASKKSSCLTCSLPNSFSHVDAHKLITKTPDGNPGWTANDAQIILYDTHDIWLMSPDGVSKKRLTNGKPSNTVYRLADYGNTVYPKDSFFGFLSKEYAITTNVLLTTQNSETYAEGFALLKMNGTAEALMERKSKMSLLDKLSDGKSFLYMESNFELPPRLALYSAGVDKEIVQSNLQQKNYYWGKSELIYYTNTKGEKLKGALFYPADYVAGKKYPMVVSIYEIKSNEVYNYEMPSQDTYLGFNISSYTADGYFVLLPDITYTVNETGANAVDCVAAAVREALKKATIDPAYIALFGHSFGGYEASYIMGHSSIFKTAVIGAPMTDLTSAYLTNDGHGFSNMWRFEYGQFRIDAPYYSEEFENNSPLKSAKDITVPILLWAGTADTQLDWKHSVKLHSALWRLGKKSTLLIYPDEGHVFADRKNRVDLSNKIKDYLDFYLKGKPLQDWMGKQ